MDRFTFPQRIRGWQSVDRWNMTAAGSPRSGHSTWIGGIAVVVVISLPLGKNPMDLRRATIVFHGERMGR